MVSDLDKRIEEINNTFATDLKAAKNSGDFDGVYLKYFSKTHGVTTLLMKELPKLSIEEKQKLGITLNKLQTDQKEQIDEAKRQFTEAKLLNPLLDVTAPERPAPIGYLHPTTQVIREMNNFFRYYGFSVAEDREIETVDYNFRKLNLPEGHPATDLQDSLFVKDPDILLRTHTSSVETRVLSSSQPPIRIVVPGKAFRNETLNKSNGAFFHQYQGVVVDKGMTIKNLKWIFQVFLQYLYGKDIKIRFRYKYYPEVSPGMGVDIQCTFCHGDGCEICKYRGWIEATGAGMIHYNTLKMCGIDPEVYTGFAWGMGLDRLVMAKFGINDLRKLYSGGMVYL
jgi:phenylalanyl-tRNA synthetase alpha chain